MKIERERPPFIDMFTDWSLQGLGKANSAMESLMSSPLSFSDPQIKLSAVDELVKFFDKHQTDPSVCLLQKVSGSLDGFFLFTAPTKVVNDFTNKMGAQLSDNDMDITEIDLAQSIMNEWANIFAGNVISSIKSPKVGIIELTSTEQAYDMSGAALDFIACQMGVETEEIAICHSSIHIKDSKDDMNVWIVINPDSLLFNLKDVLDTEVGETTS